MNGSSTFDMSMKVKDKIKRYSDSLPQDMREAVGRIYARNGHKFRTRAFQTEADKPQDSPLMEWREAMRGSNGLWTVREYKTVQSIFADETGHLEEEAGLQQKTLLSGACFFDALYACAQFEVGEFSGALNRVAVQQTTEDLGDLHYKAFGRNEGQLFDKKTHMPVPVSDGYILADDCTLEVNAAETIERSLGNNDAPDARAVETEVTPDNLPVRRKDRNIEAALVAFNKEADAKNTLVKARKSTELTQSALKGALAHKFKKNTQELSDAKKFSSIVSGFAAATGGLSYLAYYGFDERHFGAAMGGSLGALFVGAATAVGACVLLGEFGDDIYNWKRNMPRRYFKKNLQQFRADIKRLPESDLKQSAGILTNKIEIGYCLLAAREAYRQEVQNSGFLNRRRMNSTLRRLGAVAKRSGMNDHQIDELFLQVRTKLGGTSVEDKILSDISADLNDLKNVFKKLEDSEASNIKAIEYKKPSPVFW